MTKPDDQFSDPIGEARAYAMPLADLMTHSLERYTDERIRAGLIAAWISGAAGMLMRFEAGKSMGEIRSEVRVLLKASAVAKGDALP